MSEGDQFYVVDVPHAFFGVVVRDGRVVDAAPIGKWLVGRNVQAIADYARRKGGRSALLSEAIATWPVPRYVKADE